MRVVAGEFGGRTLRAPAGRGTRPTGELVRGALFAALEARWCGWVGHGVLDLYAGSGALGIEALSRGAARACFVESERTALVALRQNLEVLGVTGRARIVGRPVEDFLRRPGEGGPFALIVADPPYARGGAHLLAGLDDDSWLAAEGVLAIEHSAREELPERSGTWQRLWWRVHGGTAVTLYTRTLDRDRGLSGAFGPLPGEL